MTTSNGNTYNQYSFEAPKSAREIVTEARGSLAERAIRGVENINRAAWKVEPAAVLAALQKYHGTAATTQTTTEQTENVVSLEYRRDTQQSQADMIKDLARTSADLQKELEDGLAAA